MRRMVLAALAATASVFLLAGTANAIPGNSGAYRTTFADGGGALTEDIDDDGRAGNQTWTKTDDRLI
ncbi:hypothetical protein ABZ208_19895 [Streptomyces sp. NPDC006208]|uniref:hypothetical protein n=1 Tax=Streptomyces sp. NPDC006208 TaxID=3156734 RepID=UPI0033A4682C